jgi:hypothetical protein
LFLKADALISFYLGIPFPEELDDDTWSIKLAQIAWLGETGHLNVKLKKNE